LNLEPIDINTVPISIKFQEPIKAITEGASINIEVSQYVTLDGSVNIFHEIDKKFPQGCIQAVLISESGQTTKLVERSGRLGSNRAFVNISSVKGVPTGIEFISIQLTSCQEIKNTEVTWYNYSK